MYRVSDVMHFIQEVSHVLEAQFYDIEHTVTFRLFVGAQFT